MINTDVCFANIEDALLPTSDDSGITSQTCFNSVLL